MSPRSDSRGIKPKQAPSMTRAHLDGPRQQPATRFVPRDRDSSAGMAHARDPVQHPRRPPHTPAAPASPTTSKPATTPQSAPASTATPTHRPHPPRPPARRGHLTHEQAPPAHHPASRHRVPHSRQDSTSDPTPISTHQTPTGSPAPIALPLPPYISHRRAPPSLHSPALGSTSTEMTSTSQPRTKMPTTSTRITTPTHTKPAASAQHHEPHALHEQPEPSPITPAARDVTEHQDHHAEPLHQPARSRRARTQPRPIPIQQPAPIPRSPKTSTLSPTNHRTARRAPHTTASSGAGRAR